jgi:hypothetical protein
MRARRVYALRMMLKRCLLLSLIALSTFACTPQVIDDPIAKMLERGEDPAVRIRAANQAAAEYRTDPRHIEALHKMAWSNRHPTALRIHAVDQLVAIDEQDFLNHLNRRIVLLADWELFDHVADLGVERRWPNFSAMIVRHYALEAHGINVMDRAERDVLVRLNPGKTPEQVVFETFADFDDAVPVPQQVAAWHLLSKLYSREALLDLLGRAPDTTALTIDLKAAARDLKCLPTNREGVLWLSHLRDPSMQGYWRAAAAMVARLTPEQQQGLALRHIAVLMRVDDSIFATTRRQMLDRVAAFISSGTHYLTGPTYDGPMRDYPQEFYRAQEKLVWADLVTVDMLFAALRQPNVRRGLFNQAIADQQDTSTEYGGVLNFDADQNAYLVTPYEPLLRKHDLIYYPSDDMITALYTGLAHYHFHAQEVRNSKYAGPGYGDIQNAEGLNFNFLVLTFIDEDTLNVDYHQPGGTVVDLGVIHR